LKKYLSEFKELKIEIFHTFNLCILETAMQFSGVVRLSDLNDYIAPSQSCVVSLNGKRLQPSNEEVGNPPSGGGGRGKEETYNDI
jgi:hypothetical protein